MAKAVRIILNADVIGLGEEGTLHSVRPGYAWNYLIPKRLAECETPWALSRLEKRMDEISGRIEERRSATRTLSERVRETKLEIYRRAGQSDKLFGSVSAHDIFSLAVEQGLEIDRRCILLSKPIKTVGTHHVPVRLAHGINSELIVDVMPEGRPLSDSEVVNPDEYLEDSTLMDEKKGLSSSTNDDIPAASEDGESPAASEDGESPAASEDGDITSASHEPEEESQK